MKSQPHPLLPYIPGARYALLLLRLILPEEFNLLSRVPAHNFFKSTFYETAIPFHREALYSKSYLQKRHMRPH